MDTSPYTSPEFSESEPEEGRGRSYRITLVELLVVIGIIFILISLLLPARGTVRESARQSLCSGNCKQITMAINMYLEEHGTYPPAYIADKNGKPMHSWRVLILPYLEQQHLYDQYRLEEPWNSPHNLNIAQNLMPSFLCPNSGNT